MGISGGDGADRRPDRGAARTAQTGPGDSRGDGAEAARLALSAPPDRRRSRTQAKIETLLLSAAEGSALARYIWLLDALKELHIIARGEGLQAFAAHLASGGELLMEEIRQLDVKSTLPD